MTLAVLLLFTGLLLLYFGAEYLISGSSRLALSFGIRPLVVGMTIVALATSMPELMVSLVAALKGSSDMAAGNVIGSNIANIGLILGVAALIAPLAVARSIITREAPFMLGASVLFLLLVLDARLGAGDGLLLLAGLAGFLVYCLRNARERGLQQPLPEELQERAQARRTRDYLLILVGVAGLGFGAELMVRSATTIARAFGISELVIGLSVVAVGTSLPELAASMMSAWKGEMDISIGNVIGSNIFNLLFVLGLCPIIRPLDIDPSVLRAELPVMLAFSFGLFFLVWHHPTLTRRKGGVLLGAYLLFLGLLYV